MENENKALIKADPFSLMDNLDDRQIVAEMKGAVLKDWVYSIEIGGKRTEGLSKAGIDACTSELSRKRGEVLREIDFQIIQNPDDVIATVKAGRYVVSQDGKEVMLETVFGVKRQARQEEIYERDVEGNKVYDENNLPIKHLKDDPFVIEKALMKAARNAKKRLIPMEIQQMVLTQAREQGRIQKISDDGQGQVTTSAPLCPVHKKPMSSGKFGWYCKTKVGDGWCKAKPETIEPEPPKQSTTPVAVKVENSPAETGKGQPEGQQGQEKKANLPIDPATPRQKGAINITAAKLGWDLQPGGGFDAELEKHGLPHRDMLSNAQAVKVIKYLNGDGTL